MTATSLPDDAFDAVVSMETIEAHLRVESVIGIKAGRIVIPGDPIGTNTVVVGVRE